MGKKALTIGVPFAIAVAGFNIVGGCFVFAAQVQLKFRCPAERLSSHCKQSKADIKHTDADFHLYHPAQS
jgi:hypothetical protein